MARFLCWLIGLGTPAHPASTAAPAPALAPAAAPVHTAARPRCTPGRRHRRRRRPLAGTALPRSPWNRSAGR